MLLVCLYKNFTCCLFVYMRTGAVFSQKMSLYVVSSFIYENRSSFLAGNNHFSLADGDAFGGEVMAKCWLPKASASTVIWWNFLFHLWNIWHRPMEYTRSITYLSIIHHFEKYRFVKVIPIHSSKERLALMSEHAKHIWTTIRQLSVADSRCGGTRSQPREVVSCCENNGSSWCNEPTMQLQVSREMSPQSRHNGNA